MKWLAFLVVLFCLIGNPDLYPIIAILFLLFYGCLFLFFWIREKFKDK